jgi:c-di-GMP-binding flagellar brake protein YcgR
MTTIDPQPNTSLATHPPPPERRTHSRLVVDDTSTIILVKVGSRLIGRIIDISIGGCRIRCAEPFPVGIYTRVETEFRIEGLPFRLGGVVQAIHDHHTVGIRFLDISPRKREQVEQLVEEIRNAQQNDQLTKRQKPELHSGSHR